MKKTVKIMLCIITILCAMSIFCAGLAEGDSGALDVGAFLYMARTAIIYGS